MIIHCENIKLNAGPLSEFDPMKETILFIHGFTGSSNDWKDVSEKIDKRFNKIALDLIGHGKSDSPAEPNYYKTDAIVSQIEQVTNFFRIKEPVICGYSMGGRAALYFALEKTDKVKGLIIESSSAGIKKDSEREKRKEDDVALASFIEKNRIEDFITNWMEQEIFGTLKRFSNERLRDIKEEKKKNSPTGLANSLRGFGTGIMPYAGFRLTSLKIPVLLITGGLDVKFTRINHGLKKLFPKANHKIISTAGHNTHLEEPKKFVDAVNGFLKQF